MKAKYSSPDRQDPRRVTCDLLLFRGERMMIGESVGATDFVQLGIFEFDGVYDELCFALLLQILIHV